MLQPCVQIAVSNYEHPIFPYLLTIDDLHQKNVLSLLRERETIDQRVMDAFKEYLSKATVQDLKLVEKILHVVRDSFALQVFLHVKEVTKEFPLNLADILRVAASCALPSVIRYILENYDLELNSEAVRNAFAASKASTNKDVITLLSTSKHNTYSMGEKAEMLKDNGIGLLGTLLFLGFQRFSSLTDHSRRSTCGRYSAQCVVEGYSLRTTKCFLVW